MRVHLVCAMLLVAACDSPGESGTDAGRDAGSMIEDAGSMIEDAGSDAQPIADASVASADAAEGAVCAFNRECAADQRCECDEETGCFCRVGARGTGRGGIDPCTDGNDCASSVCVEGPDDRLLCTDECDDDTDCEPMLPRCTEIAFVGRICVREPPAS